MAYVLLFLATIIMAILPLNTPEVKTFLSDSISQIAESIQTTPAPTESAAPTPAASAAPTPTSAAGPTATPWMSEDAAAALNQKMRDFLNKEGDYTPEKISARMFDLSGMFDKSQMQLGLVDATHIEGYFFDYIEKDGSLVLLVGFDGADGERFIAPIQIPLYFIEGDLTSHFCFLQYHSDKGYSEKKADVVGLDTTALNTNLYSLIGKCIAFSPARIPFSGSKTGYSGRAKTYFEEHNAKTGLAEKLMLSVNTNEEHIAAAMTFPQIYDVLNSMDKRALEGLSIPHITQLSDVASFDLSSVPMIDPAIYYGK